MTSKAGNKNPTWECAKCKVRGTKDLFYDRTYNGKKYYSWCKNCHYEYLRGWRIKNREKHLQTEREAQLKYNKKYPEKIKAHSKAGLSKDKIKLRACEICGSQEALQMHHPDYSKPLQVKTLCRNCHKNYHHAE